VWCDSFNDSFPRTGNPAPDRLRKGFRFSFFYLSCQPQNLQNSSTTQLAPHPAHSGSIHNVIYFPNVAVSRSRAFDTRNTLLAAVASMRAASPSVSSREFMRSHAESILSLSTVFCSNVAAS
jgi:hypothetical protein